MKLTQGKLDMSLGGGGGGGGERNKKTKQKKVAKW